ncbi:hypothetical protein M092_1102 [Parabacteroides distasonis str. 3776 D15 iv]|uniref:Uncharacterized protein n=1 Tax=Parabacteroides distasonis str. 3776 D15 i TaxID=1339342 RepID=A0AB34LAE3_PARDI|nr:hypothetical protein M091_4461 [Parabacteroides distasonis str. 3776 D15 i]KDS72352.1 hypothetical protein M092_1102 [Parabacteroides distasonis str. 3776 D15 iv]
MQIRLSYSITQVSNVNIHTKKIKNKLIIKQVMLVKIDF